MKVLLAAYNRQGSKTFRERIEFHSAFESIHPFMMDEELKVFYYRGLHEWKSECGYLLDTCLAAQDKFKKYPDYFRIPYQD